MQKRIILLFLTFSLLFFSSCDELFTVKDISQYNKNTNKSNHIKIDKTKVKDDVKLSPYYSKINLKYGYSTLKNDSQRKLYAEILQNCSYITDQLDEDAPRKSYFMEPFTLYNCSFSDVDISHTRAAVFMDNPQIFWLDSYYTYSYTGSTFTITLQSTMSRKACEKRVKQLNSVVSDVLAELDDNMSDYERELFIHDYIVENCKYINNADDSVDDNPYTAFGCLVNQKAVCEGYTKAFQMLLMYCGVPSVTIKGSVQESDTVDHIWNAGKIGGSWYHTDVTWDDTDNSSMYDCFNQTESVFRQTHSFSPLLSDASEDSLRDEDGNLIAFNILIPKAKSVKYNYYRREGTNLRDMYNNSIAEDLAQTAINGDAYYYICVNPDYLDFDDVYYVLFSQDYYGFADYIRSANSIIGYDAISLSTTVIRKDSLNVIAVEINYC